MATFTITDLSDGGETYYKYQLIVQFDQHVFYFTAEYQDCHDTRRGGALPG